MYTRNKRNPTDFFKPLNARELDRLTMIWTRAEWVKKKMEERDKNFDSSSNLYRREYSALLWAIDYINAHNKRAKAQQTKQKDK